MKKNKSSERGKSENEQRKINFLKNNLMAFRLALKIYPEKMITMFIAYVAYSFLIFFSYTYMLNYVVNGLQLGKPISMLLTYVAVMSVLGVIGEILFSLYNRYYLTIINKRSEVRINKIIFKRSVESDIANYEDPAMYDLYRRVVSSGVASIDMVIDSITGVLTKIVNIGTSAWLLLKIDPVLIFFAVVPIAINFLQRVIVKLQRGLDVESYAIRRRRDYPQRVFYEREFAKEVRLTKIHKVMMRRFNEAIKEYRHLLHTKGLVVALLNLLLKIGVNTISIGGAQIYAVYHALVTGNVLIGDCLVIFSVIENFSGNILYISSNLSTFRTIGYNFQDYRDYMERGEKINQNRGGPCAEDKGDIELRGVSFRYNGAQKDTLHDINTTIHSGERIAIVGNNGAGKTTLVKLLMRLYNPTRGEIRYDGRNITEYDLVSYRDRYGVVFQDYKQIAMSVAENVLGRPYCEEDEQTVINALKSAGIWNKIENLPQGIHTCMTKEFDENGLFLSGGESQKLAIAGIYAKNCSVVILDEPSSALDPLAESEMYEHMYSACEGKTLIFISHRLSSAVSADRIIHMEDGRIIEEGSHEELMKNGGSYAQMFTMQAENYN